MTVPVRLLARRAEVRRKTNLLGVVEFPFTLTTAATFVQPAQMVFHPDDLSGTADVLITGTLDGVGQTETMQLDSTIGVLRSTKFWSTVSQIESADVISGSLIIRCAYASNEAASLESVVHENMACHIRTATRPVLVEDVDGPVQRMVQILYANESDLRIDDIVELDGITYRVEDPTPIFSPAGFHHVEAVLKRLAVTVPPNVVFTPGSGASSTTRRLYHQSVSGTFPGTVFTLPDVPVLGTDLGRLNNLNLRRLTSGTPLSGQYKIVGATVTMGRIITVDDFLEFDYDVVV